MQAPLPRRTAFLPFMLLAIGLGLTGYYGLAWHELPQYSEADIAASAELNLRMDLQRRGESLPSGEQWDQQRAALTSELRADIARERGVVETGLGAGLLALVIAAGNFVLMHLLRRDRQR